MMLPAAGTVWMLPMLVYYGGQPRGAAFIPALGVEGVEKRWEHFGTQAGR